jgi:hypothetical protein
MYYDVSLRLSVVEVRKSVGRGTGKGVGRETREANVLLHVVTNLACLPFPWAYFLHALLSYIFSTHITKLRNY